MKSLAAKMVKVLGSVSAKVEKSGYNSHQKYKYVMEADLLEAVRSELIANNVIIFTSVEEVKQEGSLTTVRTKHTFVDADSGEQFEVFSAGQGADKQDKGIYKAITGSSKYFLLKSFLLAGDDDPESESKSAGTKPSYTKRPAPAPKSVSSKKPAGGFGSKAKAANTEASIPLKEIPVEDIPF